jgi:hypothetical protein
MRKVEKQKLRRWEDEKVWKRKGWVSGFRCQMTDERSQRKYEFGRGEKRLGCWETRKPGGQKEKSGAHKAWCIA